MANYEVKHKDKNKNNNKAENLIYKDPNNNNFKRSYKLNQCNKNPLLPKEYVRILKKGNESSRFIKVSNHGRILKDNNEFTYGTLHNGYY